MTLKERDAAAVWHPFTPQKNLGNIIPIVKAEGSLLYDEGGNSYIDSISSWWVTLHGHAHPYIAQKIYEQALQLEQVIFAGFTHEPAIVLAERLLALHQHHFSKIFYSDNGSTSTEGDQKRKKILAFNNSYHGDTFGAMSVSHRSVFTLAFEKHLFEVIFIDTPTTENIGNIKSIVHQYNEEIAAFIYEPLVQGAGGMHMYDPYLFNELLNTIKLADIICIADEVMTGFGRTGKFFASDYLHKKPDILCMSKGLTGGTMALGATACTQKIYEAYLQDDPHKTFFHGHSFTANPIACSAALASLDLLENPSTIQAIEYISNKCSDLQATLKKETGFINPRSLGTILAFELSNASHGYLNNISAIITQQALTKGIFLRPLGNTVYIMPPYCINDADLCRIIDFLKDLNSL
jgi:adenosylmethionine---8-amino-7-oxononanoate aminotransferase